MKLKRCCLRGIARSMMLGTALASGIALAQAPALGAVVQEAEKRVRFNIPAQELGDALTEYARQSRQQLLYSPELVRGKSSGVLAGEYTPSEALRRLLVGSGLGFRVAPSGAFILSDAGSSPHHASLRADSQPGGTGADPYSDGQDIVVTGSSIRGQAAAGANVQIISRDDLDRSGYATVHDFMSTVTQNFSGSGASEDFSQGPFRNSNHFGGAGVDLRGLGPDATLVLINGRRVAAGGLDGDFADVSTIPQTAIERIEILTDGASAIYGSDAVGGVVNIILRKDFDGAETRLRYGRAPEGGVDEYRIGQTFGQSWEGGSLLATYEYYRRDWLQAEDRAYARTLDLRSRSGADYRLFFANPGNILDPGTFQPAYGIPANQNGKALAADDLLFEQPNFFDWTGQETLLPRQERHSGYLTATHQIADPVELFGEIRFSERKFGSIAQPLFLFEFIPSTNPFFVDPFGTGVVVVQTNLSGDLGANLRTGHVQSAALASGANVELSRWRWQTYASLTREKSRIRLPVFDYEAVSEALADPDPATALNLFGHGRANNPDTILKILDEQRYQARSGTAVVNTVLDGPLLRLGNGDVSLAVGAEYRRHELQTKLTGAGLPPPSHLSRNVYAGFAELYVPLVSPEDRIPLVEGLETSVALRHDHYSDVGGTTNPKLGIRYVPVPGVQLNATYGTSFRAPNLSELSTTNNISFVSSALDPRSSAGQSNILFVYGNDPATRPESAKTWTVGLNFRPRAIPGFSASLQYASLRFNDRIAATVETTERMLAFEEQYPGIVIRNPDNALLEAVCAANSYQGDPRTCTSDFIQVLLDQRSKNVARTTVQSLDAAAAYALEVGSTQLTFSGSATFLLEHSIKASELATTVDRAGTYGNPADFRGRGSLSLSKSGIFASVAANYTDSYRNPVAALRKKIDSYTTVDLNFGFKFDRFLRSDERGRHELSFNIINLFDSAPPFADGVWGYDGGNADPLGRFVALELKLGW